MEKVLNLFERLVIAVEKLAGNAPLPEPLGTRGDENTGEPAKKPRGRPPKTVEAPAPAPTAAAPTPAPVKEPEVKDEKPASEDDWMNEEKPAVQDPVAVSKQDVKQLLLKLQEKVLKSGDKIRAFIAANTSNACSSIADIKESDYGRLYQATQAELAKAGI